MSHSKIIFVLRSYFNEIPKFDLFLNFVLVRNLIDTVWFWLGRSASRSFHTQQTTTKKNITSINYRFDAVAALSTVGGEHLNDTAQQIYTQNSFTLFKICARTHHMKLHENHKKQSKEPAHSNFFFSLHTQTHTFADKPIFI